MIDIDSAPRSRTKEKYDQEKKALMEKAVALFREPYDDRRDRDPDAPTLSSVAAAMGTSRLRVRKLLITAEYYSTAVSRQIQELYSKGLSIPEIGEKIGISEAAVHSQLPYERCVYNLDEISPGAEDCLRFRKREKAIKELADHPDDEERLWKAIQAFEQYRFQIDGRICMQYSIECEKISFGYMTLCKEEVMNAYRNLRSIQKKNGCLENPIWLKCSGSSELYIIFLRLGACSKSV